MINNLSNLLSVVEYDGQLSGSAYLILAAMCLLIVGGLSWCLYRALKAANKNAGQQHPDEI